MNNYFNSRLTVALGGIIGFFAGGLMFSSPSVNQLELMINDSLVQVRSQTIAPSDDILLVNINRKIFLKPEIENKAKFYQEIVTWFLEQQAGVVILNLPQEWRSSVSIFASTSSDDHKSNIMKELVKNYPERVVFVAPVLRVSNNYDNRIADYSDYLPLDENLKGFTYSQEKASIIAKHLTKLEGFFEYENIESANPSGLNSPARRIYHHSNFKTNISGGQEWQFSSFGWLTLAKYQQVVKGSEFGSVLLPNSIQINYWQPGSFNLINLRDLCQTPENAWEIHNSCQINNSSPIIEKISNKIIIIGFNEGKESDILAMKSPFGKMISGMEVQANIISSLLTKSYYQSLPQWLIISIQVMGAMILGKVMTASGYRWQWLLLWMGIGYLSLAMVAFFGGWILPIASPLLTWIITAFGISIYQTNNRLVQENERKQILIAEEEAIVSKAKRLITKIWHNIHERPLQELKIAMYDVDDLAIPEQESDRIIERLSQVGKQIREYMTLDLEQELALKPELKDGLKVAMERHLEELRQEKNVDVIIITQLQSIVEPTGNSEWLTVREDIFAGFCEMINNVIHHGKNATHMKVTLVRENNYCTLTVENDGDVVNAIALEQKQGFGTQLIAEMTEYLPDGKWERIPLAKGGIKVKLTWEHKY